jgi:hypothetical protein
MWPAVGLVLLTGLYNVMHLLYATALAGGRLPSAFVQRLSAKLLLVACILLLHAVQRFVIQPRLIRGLARLQSDALVLPDDFLKLQRLSSLMSAFMVGFAIVVMLLGLLLRG